MIWDVSTPQKVIGRGHVGGGEVLTCSWNKYDEVHMMGAACRVP